MGRSDTYLNIDLEAATFKSDKRSVLQHWAFFIVWAISFVACFPFLQEVVHPYSRYFGGFLRFILSLKTCLSGGCVPDHSSEWGCVNRVTTSGEANGPVSHYIQRMFIALVRILE